MDERRVEVEAGYCAYAPTGQFLTVTDMTACGVDGGLYHTAAWAEREARTKQAWANRSWLRRVLELPPKGYEYERQQSPIMGSAMSILWPF